MWMNKTTQEVVNLFYKKNGDCCAGCDWWRWHSSLNGDCTKSAPVSGDERTGMLEVGSISLKVKAGHVITKRDHVCGDFIDTYDWGEDAA